MTEGIEIEEAQWYIASTVSGQEDSVKKNLELRVQSMDFTDRVLQVVVPTEEELVLKEGRRGTQRRKLFPGYVLVQMLMDEQSWYMVRNTPGVTGFISSEEAEGGLGPRTKPVPLSDEQLQKILGRIKSGGPRIQIGLVKGENVRITEGPFADFVGTVASSDEVKGKVKVLVSFFGRETPVELDYLQVERM